MKMTKTISLRLPENLNNELEKICGETERTKTFIIQKALSYYLNDYLDYQIALDRLNDKDDRILSLKEFRKRLNV
jgi:predicted DNA-binding protein